LYSQKDIKMDLPKFNVKIQNEKFGVLLNEIFVDRTQFKIFISMIQGCIELKNDFTYFNGNDFLVHIPHKYLIESIVTTGMDMSLTLTEHMVQKLNFEKV
jgi:hypothetical protein